MKVAHSVDDDEDEEEPGTTVCFGGFRIWIFSEILVVFPDTMDLNNRDPAPKEM